MSYELGPGTLVVRIDGDSISSRRAAQVDVSCEFKLVEHSQLLAQIPRNLRRLQLSKRVVASAILLGTSQADEVAFAD